MNNIKKLEKLEASLIGIEYTNISTKELKKLYIKAYKKIMKTALNKCNK